MSNKINKVAISLAVFFVPIFALAALTQTTSFLRDVLEIIKLLIPISFALAILFFFWGIAKYIWSVDEDKEKGKKIMIWGTIAIFVITSFWGIIRFVAGEIGINVDSAPLQPPGYGQPENI